MLWRRIKKNCQAISDDWIISYPIYDKIWKKKGGRNLSGHVTVSLYLSQFSFISTSSSFSRFSPSPFFPSSLHSTSRGRKVKPALVNSATRRTCVFATRVRTFHTDPPSSFLSLLFSNSIAMKNNPSTGREEKSVGPQRIERKLTLHRMNFYNELKNVYIHTVNNPLKNEINSKILLENIICCIL